MPPTSSASVWALSWAGDRPLAEASHLLPMEYLEEVVRSVWELLSRVD
jgi:hypothetical protein